MNKHHFLLSSSIYFCFCVKSSLGNCWISFLGQGGSTLIKADLHPLTKVPPGGRGDIPRPDRIWNCLCRKYWTLLRLHQLKALSQEQNVDRLHILGEELFSDCPSPPMLPAAITQDFGLSVDFCSILTAPAGAQ